MLVVVGRCWSIYLQFVQEQEALQQRDDLKSTPVTQNHLNAVQVRAAQEHFALEQEDAHAQNGQQLQAAPTYDVLAVCIL